MDYSDILASYPYSHPIYFQDALGHVMRDSSTGGSYPEVPVSAAILFVTSKWMVSCVLLNTDNYFVKKLK
jgi:hypothetical protein